MNEWYCEDLSKNIRSTFKAKMREGQFLGSSCPYGYIKDPENNNYLIIDEYAAGVVRKIFDLYLQGYSKAKIGSILSSENILIPSFMWAKELKKIKAKAANNQKSDNIFAGILFCGDCKHTMGRFYKRRGGHGSVGYICSTYNRMGKQFCTNHMIRNEELKEAVLASIKEQARIILTEDDIDDLSKIRK